MEIGAGLVIFVIAAVLAGVAIYFWRTSTVDSNEIFDTEYDYEAYMEMLEHSKSKQEEQQKWEDAGYGDSYTTYNGENDEQKK